MVNKYAGLYIKIRESIHNLTETVQQDLATKIAEEMPGFKSKKVDSYYEVYNEETNTRITIRISYNPIPMVVYVGLIIDNVYIKDFDWKYTSVDIDTFVTKLNVHINGRF